MRDGEGIGHPARRWPLIRRFTADEERLGRWFEARGLAGLYEFLRFGVKQGWACLFGGAMLALLIGTHLFWPAGAPVARYDALFAAALLLQVALLAFRLETPAEAGVILLFHAVGTAMEVFKTAQGSWLYPEPSLLRIGGVPLFSGFLYACVGSYIARAWRLFDFRLPGHPSRGALLVLAAAIYANFFLHHYLPDARVLLFLATAWLFRRSWVWFRVWHVYRRMPLLLGFGLVSLFIWLAENLGTFTRGWIYPGQHAGWSPVSLHKFGAWFLLMIVSYAMVYALHRPGRERARG